MIAEEKESCWLTVGVLDFQKERQRKENRKRVSSSPKLEAN